MTPFAVAFHHAAAHGVLSAVHLPDTPEPVPDSVLERLAPAEAEYARTLRAYRQVSFVGGRLALREAAAQLGHVLPAVLPDERNRPLLPEELAGSISHKRDLAIGLVSAASHGSIGVDLEDYSPARPGIEEHVLVASERQAIAALPENRRWIALLVRFSVKEAIYKALDPFVQRYVGFHEAVVVPDVEGTAEVTLTLTQGEGPFSVDARYEWLNGRLLTSVRVRRAGAGGHAVANRSE